MSTIYRSRTAISAFAAVLTFALAVPFAVNAEEQVLVPAPAGPSWDEMSGYGAVEAGRAAQHALLSGDLGSTQSGLIHCRPCREEALAALLAAGTARDETRSADYLPSALASGTRSESAHLATVPLPDDAVRANSDDRIANALFGDEARGNGSAEATRTER